MSGLYDSILITGGGGMLGHSLADLLRVRGRQPVALDRAALDIADTRALEEAFARYRPTLVLNCAAHTKVDLCEAEEEKANAVNGHAVGQLARLCRRSDAALVHVSTDFVFDGVLARPFRIDDPVNPINAYGRSKLLGEVELQRQPPRRWLMVRTAWVYGRHGINFPRTMVQAARAGKPLKVVSDQHGSPTYSNDLAEAIVDLLDRGGQGIFHVTNSGQTTWHEFAVATLREFGISVEVGSLTSGQWAEIRPSAAVRPHYSVLDLTATEAKLDRPMRPWQAGLSDFAKTVGKLGF